MGGGGGGGWGGGGVHCWLYDSLRAWRIQCRERQVRSIEQWYVHESGKQVLHTYTYV